MVARTSACRVADGLVALEDAGPADAVAGRGTEGALAGETTRTQRPSGLAKCVCPGGFSKEYTQPAQRCADLAIACSVPTLSDALMKLAAEYVVQSHKQLAAGQRHPQLDPLGFGD